MLNLFGSTNPRRVTIDPNTGIIASGRKAGKPIEKLCGRHDRVELGTVPGLAYIVDSRRYEFESDPYNFHKPVDSTGDPVKGAIPVDGGWLTPVAGS